MVDTCTITRPDPDAPWVENPETGYEEPPPGDEVYAGRCKVTSFQPYESDREAGGATVTTQRYFVHVPVTAGPFEIGDLVTITSGANEPTTIGRKFRVAGLHEKTWQTAQRLLVDEGA